MIKYIGLLCASVLAGCSSTWVPISQNTRYTSQEADIMCNMEAGKVFPVKNEIATETVWKAPELICKDSGKKNTKEQRCYADPYAILLQDTKIRSYVVDVNKGSRKYFYTECMNQKGWKKTTRFLW